MTTSDMTGAREHATATRKQRALRWLPSFVGFPIGGFIAIIAASLSTIATARALG